MAKVTADTILTVADSATADTASTDSIVADTVRYIMIAPETPARDLPVRNNESGDMMSWVVGGLILLFAIVAVRFSRNSKYLGAILRDATDVRERRNVFDDTVRETSFLLMMNLLWGVCAGILLYQVIGRFDAGTPGDVFESSIIGAARGMGICIGCVLGYLVLMSGAYAAVGNIFSDEHHTSMWVRGFWGANGLCTLLFFPLALVALCYPSGFGFISILAIAGFILAKMMFIIKGFRIFFTEITSWVLFLYYLCSLEIVPLVVLYIGYNYFCHAPA